MLSTNDLSTGYASMSTGGALQRKGNMVVKRITFVSSDGQTTDNKTYRFSMPEPLNNVVYADWSIAHNLPFDGFLQIQEIPARGLTSARQPYLALLPKGAVQQNISISHQPPVLNQPVSLNTVTVVINPVTTALISAYDTLATETWAIEVWFYVTE
jgi:hypothetical protein